MTEKRRGLPTGVVRKHSRTCPAYKDKDARCRGGAKCRYQVQAGPRGNRQTKTVATVDEAKAWKRDVDKAKASGKLTRKRAPTLVEAFEAWEVDAIAGVAMARGNRRFKASTLYSYRRVYESEMLEAYGAVRLDQLGDQLDAFVTKLQRRGLAASTISNIVMPLRALYRHAIRMKWVATNPTLALELPAADGRRMKVVEADVIPDYLSALEERDRPLWAVAFYGGLRRGEIMALRWIDVDLASGMLVVDAEVGNYDYRTKVIGSPKSAAGARKVPIGGDLREHLLAHRARAGARATGLVFATGSIGGRGGRGVKGTPFDGSSVGRRAHKAWTAAGLPPITLHDCRHTFASLLIAAMGARGVFNPKLIQQVMGHSSIQVTYDRYGHLFPGQEAELGIMLDEFLHGDSDDDARPEVAEAVSRLLAAIADADPRASLPEVTQALEAARTWEQQALAAADARTLAGSAERAVTVQRTPRRGGRQA